MEWQNGRMAEWQNSIMAEWRKWRTEWLNGGRMAEWREWQTEWSNGGRMAEWSNGGMARMVEWSNGGRMAEWLNGGMARMAELRNGGMAEWHMEWGNDGWNGYRVHIDDLIVVLRQNGRMAAEWRNG